jgi:hypothetical protein
MKKILTALTLAVTLAVSPACVHFSKAATPEQKVADVVSKVESSATQLLKIAQTAQTDGVISKDQLDHVALAVDKIGHLGVDLNVELQDYSKLKAAGKDVAKVVALIDTTKANLLTTLSDLGVNFPPSVKAGIDTVVNIIISLGGSL